MKYAIYYKKRPSQTPGVPANVQEVYAFEVVSYHTLEELEERGYRKPDDDGYETAASATAAAEAMIGHAL
ncbi:hypothetical protein ACFS7Z_16435 [Pontibacter toksunensis]|uniref:Uncharacterized protein n=1 Tax=Pontibacter toksunensis TaxID=1332631 RepID=A0ABW6BYA1_9BACT